MSNVEFKTSEIFYQGQPLQIEYFLRRGWKGTILYLHGLGCSKDDFIESANIHELQAYTLISFDFPGCGDSPYPKDMTIGIDDLVKITSIVVSKLNLSDLVVIGHSMGGLVALLYVEKNDTRVKGFINVEGNLAPEDCFFSRKVTKCSSIDATREFLEHLQNKLARSESNGLRQYARQLQRASEKACFDCSPSLVDYSDRADLLQRFIGLKIPKLFLYGSENRGLSYIPSLRDSKCEVAEIPNSGHFTFYDNSYDYYHAISQFINPL